MEEFSFTPDDKQSTPEKEFSGFSFTPDEKQPDFSKIKEAQLKSPDGSNVNSISKMGLVMEFTKNLFDPKNAIGLGMKAAETIKPAIDFVQEQRIETPEDYASLGKGILEAVPETAKGAAREIAVNTPKIASDILRMASINLKSGEKEDFVSGSLGSLADMFQNVSEYMGDIEVLKPDEKLMEGSFQENPSWKRAGNVIGGGAGQGLTMAALAKIGGSKLAYGFYALAGGADVFHESYEKDKDLGKANTLAALNTATTYMIDRWFDPLPENIASGAKLTAGQIAKEIGKAAYKEPASEILQQVYAENLTRKIGLDKTQDLYEGIIESAIGALGGAAAMGGVSGTMYAADRAYSRARENALAAGATPEDIQRFEQATISKLEKHPEAFNTVFQQNVQQTIADIDKFVKENGNPEEVRKAMQTKADLEEVYNKTFEILKDKENNAVASAHAKVIQGISLWGSRELGISPLEYFEQRFPEVEKISYKDFMTRGKERISSLREDISRLKRGISSKSQETRKTLSEFIKEQGGITDDRGDILAMNPEKGILSSSGLPIDEMTRRAWEAGYIQGETRPEINQLLDLLDNDIRGNKVYSSNEEMDSPESNRLYYANLNEAIERSGEDIYKDDVETIYEKLKTYEESLGNKDNVSALPEEDLSDFVNFQGQIADNGRNVELTINSQEEMQELSEEDFKNKMLDTLKSFKGNKIFNQSLKGNIEIRTSSIKKYKSFFADKNKRLIVPYIPELLAKAKFGKEENYAKASEPNIKAYYKADLPININEENYNVHLTVREDQYGNFFWDAQIKEESQHATPATNPGDTGLTSELSEDTLSISRPQENVNKTLYQLPPEAYNKQGKADINSKEFKDWFGDSKVVDENGRPLVVYHSSPAENIEVFNNNQTRSKSDKVGFYFSSREDSSKTYGKNTYPVYLRMKNPLIVDYDYKYYYEEMEVHGQKMGKSSGYADTSVPSMTDIAKYALDNGYDGVIAKNVIDNANNAKLGDVPNKERRKELSRLSLEELHKMGDWGGNIEIGITALGGKRRYKEYLVNIIEQEERHSKENRKKFSSTTYIVFNANQIKSVYNRGTFSSESDNIYYQDQSVYRDPKGAFSQRLDARSLISLFERADASTFMHETAHFFFEELKTFAKTSEQSAKMLDAVNKWLGSDGETYTLEQTEQFARGFEQYLREGKTPSNYLKRTFDAFINWLRQLYRTATELNVKLNDDVRAVYGEILGGQEIDRYLEAPIDEILGNSKKYWKAKRDAMDKVYQQNAEAQKVSRKIISRGVNAVQKIYSGMRDFLSDSIIPLEEEIKQISPELYAMNRRLEIAKIQQTKKYFNEIKGFVEKAQKMSAEDFYTFDLALKNRDVDKAAVYLEKYNMTDDFAKVRKVLDDLREQMIEVGVDVAYLTDYYPRVIKDTDGLLDYVEVNFSGRPEYSIFQKILEEKRKDGRIRTKEDEAQIINSLIRGYSGGITLANISNVKERSIQVVDQYLNQFYKNSLDALTSYVSGAVQTVENKKYFGKETKELQRLRRMVANRETTISEYQNMEAKEAKWKEIKTRNYKIGAVEAQIRNTFDKNKKAELQERKTKLEAEVEFLQKRRAEQVKEIAINRMQVELNEIKKEVDALADSTIENSVGNLLLELSEQGKIGHTQEMRLKELLLARFSNKGLGSEFFKFLRDGGYIWTLGNIESAITQFGDLGTSAYQNGLWNTAFEYAKAWVGKSEITVDDLGLEGVIKAGGYTDVSALAKYLDKALKYTGFEKMDKIAKQTLVNSAVRKARADAKAEKPELEEYLKAEFGEKWVDVREDMKTGALTDEIIEYAMFKLLDVQPVTIDQMPKYYAEGGKKRMFYMMKSYFIKQLNEYRKIVFEMARKNPKKAVIAFMVLTFYLMIFNAGADVLKDLIFGREINVPDSLIDNIFIGGSINRYQAMKVKREGLFKTLQQQLMFPVMMDELIVDMLSNRDIKNWETWKNVPLVGRPYYWWFGGGHYKEEKKHKRKQTLK